MRISKYGHACLLIEEGEARILVDPGAFSKGFENLEGLQAILITHQHQDHLVPENIKALLEKNPEAKVYADEASAKLLEAAGVTVTAVKAGDSFDIAGVGAEVVGEDHAIIHHDIATIPNVGYVVASKFYYPGDSYTLPGKSVDVLAAPAGAPWLKIEEAVDFVRAVQPRIAVPVHDAVLAMPQMHYDLMERLTQPQGVTVKVIANGETAEL